MTGLCGWAGASPTGMESDALLQRMSLPLTRFRPFTPRFSHAEGIYTAVVAAQADGGFAQREGVALALAGQGRSAQAPAAAGDALAQHVLDIYLASGERAALRAIEGSFVAAISDSRRQQMILAVDRCATIPLSYEMYDGAILFGSSADAINAHPQARRELNKQAIFDYVYFHMVPAPVTAYRAMQRLLPGEYVTFRKGEQHRARYWELEFNEYRQRDFESLKTEFLRLLRASVSRSIADQSTGAFLSGGTDSSTIAGILGEVTGAPAKTYSIGFDHKQYDEMEYARIAASHFGTQHHELYVTAQDVVEAIPLIAAVHDQPFGNSSAVPAYFCARLAKSDGVDRLLGGDGGDELFGGNERYAKQRIFALYSGLPRGLRRRLIEPVVRAVPGGHALPAVRKLRSYISQANVPLPARLETYNLLTRFGFDNVFTADFLSEVDSRAPSAALEQTYRGARADSALNRMLALDYKFTLADNDLPKVVKSCELVDVTVVFPLLDCHLVEFAAELQPHLKLKGTRLRYFFKEALRGFLPDAILTKQKHGFGLPFGPWLETHRPLREIAFDSLGALKARNIVRPEFIDELTSVRLAEHADYYGTMVWVLLMLEQWLQQHIDPSQPGT